MTTVDKHSELLPHLFRQEFSKMTAVLCRHFGLQHIEIAEDIVSETFLKAVENWTENGVPENPTAWLYAVAKNKAKDFFKRRNLFESQIKENIKPSEFEIQQELEFNHQNISDSQLAMIFSVCNPAISSEAQIALALQILCGFSVEEIANAFLDKPETVKKRLQRGREKLRNNSFQINNLNETEIGSRLDVVLKTLYLLFNEGYFSKSNNHLIRKELCIEAMRLTVLLTEYKNTNTPKSQALLALMCYQSSRLEARTDVDGNAVLYDEQDRSLWDKKLIEQGHYHLVNAFENKTLSKYHYEAAIAYWHTAPEHPDKWKFVLQLYNQLLLEEYSPIAALNRSFAYAKVFGNESAIYETEKLNLTDSSYYHGLLGYLYAETDIGKAILHYENAIGLTKSKTEKQTIEKEVKRLKIMYKRNNYGL